jgi:hypothetical protein
VETGKVDVKLIAVLRALANLKFEANHNEFVEQEALFKAYG